MPCLPGDRIPLGSRESYIGQQSMAGPSIREADYLQCLDKSAIGMVVEIKQVSALV